MADKWCNAQFRSMLINKAAKLHSVLGVVSVPLTYPFEILTLWGVSDDTAGCELR